MYSVSKLAVLVALSGSVSLCFALPVLRVCSDPNNLPFSNREQQGFENKIADLIAHDLHMQVSYFWYPQREKFFKNTLNSGLCDVVMGVPSGFEESETTRPYYRSTYVFIARSDRNLRIDSFDDPRLKSLRIGVHVLGEQDDSLPPVHALTSRGIVRNLVGYSIFGNLAEANPASDLIKAVINKDVDVAIVWGPLAGYFTQKSGNALQITPVDGDPMHPQLPLAFDISIGVREGETQLKKTLNGELVKRHDDIQRMLASYGIPQIPLAPHAVVAEK